LTLLALDPSFFGLETKGSLSLFFSEVTHLFRGVVRLPLQSLERFSTRRTESVALHETYLYASSQRHKYIKAVHKKRGFYNEFRRKAGMDTNETCLQIEKAIQTLPLEFVKVSQWNPETIKIEISSNTFEGKRRLDRFEMLDSLLKEKLPEIFPKYKFIYKAFTEDEWEVRQLGI
jgi:stress-induced morphogen